MDNWKAIQKQVLSWIIWTERKKNYLLNECEQTILKINIYENIQITEHTLQAEINKFGDKGVIKKN